MSERDLGNSSADPEVRKVKSLRLPKLAKYLAPLVLPAIAFLGVRETNEVVYTKSAAAASVDESTTGANGDRAGVIVVPAERKTQDVSARTPEKRVLEAGENLLLNPSFENGTAEGGPNDWDILNALSSGNATYELTGGFDGERFVKAQAYGDPGGNCQGAGWGGELFAIDPNKNYLFQYFAKYTSNNPNLSIGSWVDIVFYNSQVTEVVGLYEASTPASGLGSWEEVNALTVGPGTANPIPANAAFGLVDLFAKGTLPEGQFCTDGVAAGEVGFDKVVFAEMTPVGGIAEFPEIGGDQARNRPDEVAGLSAEKLAVIAAAAAGSLVALGAGARFIRRRVR